MWRNYWLEARECGGNTDLENRQIIINTCKPISFKVFRVKSFMTKKSSKEIKFKKKDLSMLKTIPHRMVFTLVTIKDSKILGYLKDF